MSTGIVVGACVVALGSAAPAKAIHDLVIERDEVTTGAPFSVVLIDEVDVEPELVGASCAAQAEVDNQESTHPNTDLIFTTGSSSAVLADVENTPGQKTAISGEMVIGATVRIELQLGDDGISSAKLRISFHCPEPAPATTTPTTSSIPPSPESTSTGSSGPPSATSLPATGNSSLAVLWVGGMALVAAGLGLAWGFRRSPPTSR